MHNDKTRPEQLRDSAAQLHRVFTHLSQTEFAAIPPAGIARAKAVVLDVLGCIVSGGNTTASQRICALVKGWKGQQESSVWGQGFKSTAQQAAFATAIMARAFDFGVGGSSALTQGKAPVHIAETLVPVALAMAERQNASGKAMLTALITGEDLAGRLSACLDFSANLDCRGTVNTLGAVAVAGKLLGLAPEDYGQAFALALHQLNGIKQGTQFNLGQGFSAMNGILGAELASAGIAGASDVLKEGNNLLSILGANFDPAPLFDGLGQQFHSSVSFKPYPCCRATHSAVECARELRQQGLKPEQIRQVIVRVSPWAMNHPVARPFALRENIHADAIFSLQYAVASTLLRGTCTLDHFTEQSICDPAVQTMAARITLTSAGWPAHKEEPRLAALLEVETQCGRRLTAYCRFPRGHETMGQPLSIEEKKQKFTSNLLFGGAYSLQTIEAVYDLAQNLESLPHLGLLSETLQSRPS